MLRYFIRRLMAMIPTLLAISVIIFFIIQLPPGDFLETYISELQSQGQNIDQAKIQFLREQYGLDQPFYVQYADWIWGLLHGDLGYSFEYNMPVNDLVGDRIWLTVVLAVSSIIFTYVVAFPIGVYSAVRQYSAGDYFFSFLGYIGLATPNFLLALVLLYLFNVWFGTSIGGLMDPQFVNQPMSWAKALSVAEHMWVPIIVIGTSGTAALIRRLRANLLDELHKQYVVTARAKGLGERRLVFKYPLRLALNPFIADIGNLLPQLISGAVLVSVVLDLPTTGPLLLAALQSQDMYLAGSFLFLQAVLVVIGVFVSDLLLALLDPRIRMGGGAIR